MKETPMVVVAFSTLLFFVSYVILSCRTTCRTLNGRRTGHGSLSWLKRGYFQQHPVCLRCPSRYICPLRFYLHDTLDRESHAINIPSSVSIRCRGSLSTSSPNGVDFSPHCPTKVERSM
ncbi:hypothetical protein BJX63DRAFT_277254 [Aspergillus granulosus]|uniref:Secreted protein n=1 Tax=Aspergillus granulosus TaxID=176169 RepID=A0ABR4H785_9EURO